MLLQKSRLKKNERKQLEDLTKVKAEEERKRFEADEAKTKAIILIS
jgi:hypothetical protein